MPQSNRHRRRITRRSEPSPRPGAGSARSARRAPFDAATCATGRPRGKASPQQSIGRQGGPLRPLTPRSSEQRQFSAADTAAAVPAPPPSAASAQERARQRLKAAAGRRREREADRPPARTQWGWPGVHLGTARHQALRVRGDAGSASTFRPPGPNLQRSQPRYTPDPGRSVNGSTRKFGENEEGSQDHLALRSSECLENLRL